MRCVCTIHHHNCGNIKDIVLKGQLGQITTLEMFSGTMLVAILKRQLSAYNFLDFSVVCDNSGYFSVVILSEIIF